MGSFFEALLTFFFLKDPVFYEKLHSVQKKVCVSDGMRALIISFECYTKTKHIFLFFTNNKNKHCLIYIEQKRDYYFDVSHLKKPLG